MILNSQKCQYKLILQTRNSDRTEKNFKLQPFYHKLHYLKFYKPQLLASKTDVKHFTFFTLQQDHQVLYYKTQLPYQQCKITSYLYCVHRLIKMFLLTSVLFSLPTTAQESQTIPDRYRSEPGPYLSTPIYPLPRSDVCV